MSFEIIADESEDVSNEEEAKEEPKKDDRELISEFVEEFIFYEGLLKSYQDPENGNTYLELSDEDIQKNLFILLILLMGLSKQDF